MLETVPGWPNPPEGSSPDLGTGTSSSSSTKLFGSAGESASVLTANTSISAVDLIHTLADRYIKLLDTCLDSLLSKLQP